jgi:hypothetical protein
MTQAHPGAAILPEAVEELPLSDRHWVRRESDFQSWPLHLGCRTTGYSARLPPLLPGSLPLVDTPLGQFQAGLDIRPWQQLCY